MVRCSQYRWPSPDEVSLVDEAAEQAALKMLEEDAARFHCWLTNPRVSRLEDMKIVRMDLTRDDASEPVGVAMCVENEGLSYLGIFID